MMGTQRKNVYITLVYNSTNTWCTILQWREKKRMSEMCRILFSFVVLKIIFKFAFFIVLIFFASPSFQLIREYIAFNSYVFSIISGDLFKINNDPLWTNGLYIIFFNILLSYHICIYLKKALVFWVVNFLIETNRYNFYESNKKNDVVITYWDFYWNVSGVQKKKVN